MKSIYGKFMYLQTVAQGLTQIFSDFIYTNASHGSDSQSPDEGIWVLCILIIPLNLFCLTTIEQYNSYLLESIYSQNCTLWLAFGIVHNVQIYKFLELQVVCLHTVQHVSEQHRHILAHGHEGNHLLDCLLLFILFLWVQLFLELVDLTYGVLPAVPQHKHQTYLSWWSGSIWSPTWVRMGVEGKGDDGDVERMPGCWSKAFDGAWRAGQGWRNQQSAIGTNIFIPYIMHFSNTLFSQHIKMTNKLPIEEALEWNEVMGVENGNM